MNDDTENRELEIVEALSMADSAGQSGDMAACLSLSTLALAKMAYHEGQRRTGGRR